MQYEIQIDGGVPAGALERLAVLHGEGVKKIATVVESAGGDEGAGDDSTRSG